MIKKQLFLTVCLSLFTLGLFLPAGVFAGSVAVITNKSVAPGTVDADTIKKIYSGYITKWPDNSRITLAILENDPVHEEFLKTYVGKTKSQFTATWKKLMFTGKGKFPTKFDSMDQLIDYVAKTDGAIGYVSAGASPQGVSVQK